MAALSLWNPKGPEAAHNSQAGLPWSQGHLGHGALLPALPKSALSSTDSKAWRDAISEKKDTPNMATPGGSQSPLHFCFPSALPPYPV